MHEDVEIERENAVEDERREECEVKGEVQCEIRSESGESGVVGKFKAITAVRALGSGQGEHSSFSSRRRESAPL